MLSRVHVVTVTDPETGSVEQQAVFYSEAQAHAAYKSARSTYGDEHTMFNHHSKIHFGGTGVVVREIIRRAQLMRRALQQLMEVK